MRGEMPLSNGANVLGARGSMESAYMVLPISIKIASSRPGYGMSPVIFFAEENIIVGEQVFLEHRYGGGVQDDEGGSGVAIT